jgi:hypothetical protein
VNARAQGPAARHETTFDLVARIFGAAGLGGAAYFWFAYAGPYRWFAELQIAWFGGYRPLLTGALTLVLLTLVPVALAYVVLVRLRVLKAFDPGNLSSGQDEPSPARGTLAYVFAGLLWLGFSSGGVVELWRGRGGDAHETHAVASLAAREPGTRLVTLTGRLATERAFSYLERGNRAVRHEYVPLVPAGWTPSDPVSVVVEYRSYDAGAETGSRAEGEATVSGTLHSSGIPGFLLERANLRFGHQHYVLMPGEVPKQTRARGFSLIVLDFSWAGSLQASPPYVSEPEHREHEGFHSEAEAPFTTHALRAQVGPPLRAFLR